MCDSRCRAAEGIYAVGDVARWHHEVLGTSLRLENRTNAAEQAVVAAANILGEDHPYTPVPYYWSDQFDVKIQVYGAPTPEAEAHVVEGSPEEGRFVVRFAQEDRTVGVLGWNMPDRLASTGRRSWSGTSAPPHRPRCEGRLRAPSPPHRKKNHDHRLHVRYPHRTPRLPPAPLGRLPLRPSPAMRALSDHGPLTRVLS
ncbi:oxidoreductase C-terminal domain-containing protein [Streptomyces microflavus]